MSGVCGVSGSKDRCFSEEQLEALGRDDSTSAVANKARRAAGGKEADVTVRGDDRTLDEVLHRQKNHVNAVEAGAAALHGLDVAEAMGVGHAISGAGPRAIEAVALGALGLTITSAIGGLAAGLYGMHHMETVKAERKDAATRDQLHAAIVWKLEVPEGFRNEELRRLNVSTNAHDPAMKIADQIASGGPLHATLQLHCDRGMHAAQDMIRSGQTQAAFLASHPTVGERYAADPAFKNGFDALVWSKAQDDGGATFAEQVKALESRDAWYSHAHIQVRS